MDANPRFWPAMRGFLLSPWDEQEKASAVTALTELDQAMSALDTLAAERGALNFPALELARSYASNTLKPQEKEREQEISSWQKALQLSALSLQNNEPLSYEMILNWNTLLRNDSEKALPSVRTIDMYLTREKLLPPDELKTALDDFRKDVLENPEEEPLHQASKIYQWLISIHPFPNGNGRTARLSADYILLQNGYLPMVFASPLSSSVALFAENPRRIRPFEAFEQVLRGVNRSIDILSLPT